MSHEYEWSDAWLLQAIIVGGGDQGATLFNIISAGDGLNHAIFTNDELESGFARLSAGGLIEERNGIFFATTKSKDLYSKASSRPGSIHTVRDRLAKGMGAAAWQPNCPNPKNTFKYPGFSPEKVNEAIKEWHEEARKMMNKIDKKRRTSPSS